MHLNRLLRGDNIAQEAVGLPIPHATVRGRVQAGVRIECASPDEPAPFTS